MRRARAPLPEEAHIPNCPITKRRFIEVDWKRRGEFENAVEIPLDNVWFNPARGFEGQSVLAPQPLFDRLHSEMPGEHRWRLVLGTKRYNKKNPCWSHIRFKRPGEDTARQTVWALVQFNNGRDAVEFVLKTETG